MVSDSSERPLLAKSPRNGREITLREHLQDTAKAARLIYSPEHRVGRNFLRSFGLGQDEAAEFLLNLEIACLLHDIGKANEGFADAIRGNRSSQVIRHEHLSALVLGLPEVVRWLNTNPRIRRPCVLGAVLSHHLKASLGDLGAPLHGGRVCALHLQHDDVSAALREVALVAGLDEPPILRYSFFCNTEEPWNSLVTQLKREGQSFRRSLSETEGSQDGKDRRLLAALKSALIICDAVSSAVVREGGSIEDWLIENLHVCRLTGEDLFEKIISRCTDAISARNGVPFKPAKFQVEAANLPSQSVLSAGCGAGKTLAAYYWAARQLDSGEYGRVIFLYPTRGTATEGFKDYTGWAPDGEALLLHGTSRYALECMLENPPDSGIGKNYLNGEASDRFYSLANYSRRFISATVDQFLSFLQFNYSSICMSAVLADSVVVIDEVHSFDRKLFNTLLEFLKSMHVPTLCMTATLHTARAKELEALGLRVFPSKDAKGDLKDLTDAEESRRYEVQWIQDEAQAVIECKQALKSGEKILWVVNTVDRCQRLAATVRNIASDVVICYHSRYKLEDREKWHQQCVRSFRAGCELTGGVVAITTQVCEMSLDLDADRLISELAPISSLIQRMGRINRHPSRRPAGFLAPVRIYQTNNRQDLRGALPYLTEDLTTAKAFVDSLVENSRDGTSQRMLAEAMEQLTPEAEREIGASARLFESGYFATPAELRDIDEYAVTALLDDDLDQVEKLVRQSEGIERLLVPVPRSFVIEEQRPSWLPRQIKIASGKLYDEALGFCTKSWR